MWEPIVKDNKLYGLSLNPYGKIMPNKTMLSKDLPTTLIEHHLGELISNWKAAESQRRLVEVDEAEYNSGMFGYIAWINSLDDFITKYNTFTADESNGKLINLKVI